MTIIRGRIDGLVGEQGRNLPDLWVDGGVDKSIKRISASTENGARSILLELAAPSTARPIGAVVAFDGHLHLAGQVAFERQRQTKTNDDDAVWTNSQSGGCSGIGAENRHPAGRWRPMKMEAARKFGHRETY